MRDVKRIIFILLSAVMLVALSAAVSASDDKIVIVLDPGHGGHDPGTTVGTRYESEYNYDVALYLKEELEKTGEFEVHLTRARDQYKVYLLRSEVAFNNDADLLLSLHFNSNPELDPTLNGVEVLASVLDEWYPKALAESICSSISQKCGLKNGGVLRKYDTGDARGVYYWNEEIGWDVPGTGVGRVSDYYSMIAWGTKLGIPSMIVEHAYLSSPSDRAFCDSADGLRLLAKAEAEALIKYFTGHTHTYGPETCDRRANCCIGGVYSKKCTQCGHRTDVRRTAVDPAVHAWTVESQQVTCTTDGYVNRECQISRNLSEKGYDHISIHRQNEYYPATGHALTVQIDTPASHAVDGLLRECCTNCGGVFDTVRYGDPHVFVNVESVAVTCEADGRDTYECTVCAYTYADAYTALGHQYESDGEPLTCASDGTKEYTCKRCGDVVSENIEVPPHTFELSETVEPTCEADGKTVVKCSVCALTEETVIPAIGHSYAAEGEERIAPTYFAEGLRVFVCENDEEHSRTEVIEKKPGGIFIIIAVVAAVVALTAGIALLTVKGARRRLAEIGDETAEVLMGDVSEASADGRRAEIVTEDVIIDPAELEAADCAMKDKNNV